VVNRPGVALMSVSHGVDDLYQGIVPAMLPFLATERHYSYAAVSGLTLAATVLSSVAQPAFGWLTDRRPGRWMIPAGMTVAGVGIAVAGLFSSYLLTWLAVAVSGLGIAAFHPEAARAARQAAGDSTRAMSVFALGGNAGYALGAFVTGQLVVALGVWGGALAMAPVLASAFVLARSASRLRLLVPSRKPGAGGVVGRWPGRRRNDSSCERIPRTATSRTVAPAAGSG
jgi:FSR family fosmidomycin resistance protein-like MFS transporter